MWRWGALVASLVGDIAAREFDRAFPRGGTAGRPNRNRAYCPPELTAPLQEIAAKVSRALACLTDRLRWPYCLPLMAEMCLDLREEIVGVHEAYRRCVTYNDANPILPGLYNRLAQLLGHSVLAVRDHTPRDRDGEIISVQDWLATIGETQPLAQKRECDGSNAAKETLVKTVESNLVEHHARHSGSMQSRQGSAAPPHKHGLAAVASTAAHQQTVEGGRIHTPLAQQRESDDLEEPLVQTIVSYPLVEHRARRSSKDDVHTLLVRRLAAAEERSTICQAEMRRRHAHHREEMRALMARLCLGSERSKLMRQHGQMPYRHRSTLSLRRSQHPPTANRSSNWRRQQPPQRAPWTPNQTQTCG